jgi:hypothetical protein
VIVRRGVVQGEPCAVPTSAGPGVPVFHNHQDAKRFIDANPETIGPEQLPWGLPDNQLADALERTGAKGVGWVCEISPGWRVPAPGIEMAREQLESYVRMLRTDKK